MSRRRRVLVVGSARSGTTLVTRIIAESVHVDLCPIETHYWDKLIPTQSSLAKPRLLSAWLQRRYRRRIRRISGQQIPPITGQTLGTSSISTFWSLVSMLSPSKGDVLLEKTPDHIRSIDRILQLDDSVKVVAVVRAPESVVRSALQWGWALRAASLWMEWCHENQLLADTIDQGNHDRVHVISYDRMMTIGESEVFSELSRFLDLATTERAPLSEPELFPANEKAIKQLALGPIYDTEQGVDRSDCIGFHTSSPLRERFGLSPGVSADEKNEVSLIAHFVEILDLVLRMKLIDSEHLGETMNGRPEFSIVVWTALSAIYRVLLSLQSTQIRGAARLATRAINRAT